MGTSITDFSNQVAIDAGSPNAHRRNIRLISGTNISLSKVDDPTNNEVEVTLNSTSSAKPTVGQWGSNSQTISSTLTLTTASDVIQLIRCTSDQIVKLPAPGSASNQLLIIANTGSSTDGDLNVTVNGVTLKTIAPDNACIFVPTDTSWFAFNQQTVTPAVLYDEIHTLRWGWSGATGAGINLQAYNVSSYSGSATQAMSELPTIATTYTQFKVISASAYVGAGTVVIRKKGSGVTTVITFASLTYTLINGLYVATIPVSVVSTASDRLYLTHGGVSTLVAMTFELTGLYSTAGSGYMVFGRDYSVGFTTGLSHFGGSIAYNAFTAPEITAARIPYKLTATHLRWSISTSAPGTTLQIKKTGATVATVVLTAGTDGSIPFAPVVFNAGDLIQVNSTGGGTPGKAIYSILYEFDFLVETTYADVIWATGHVASIGNKYDIFSAMRDSTEPLLSSADTVNNTYMVTRKGTLQEIATSSTGAAWTSVDVYKNGALSETVLLTSSLGTASTYYNEMDALNFVATNTTHDGSIMAMIRGASY